MGKYLNNSYSMLFIHITFKEHIGYLNTDTNNVYFYHFKYSNIKEAIENVEYDLEKNAEEIQIFNELMKQLQIV